MAYVYMLRCENGSLYTGWTSDLKKRLQAHQSGKGAKYTKGFGAHSLAWAEFLADKPAALRREAAVKKLPKAEKEALAAGFDAARFVMLRPAVAQDANAITDLFAYYVKNSTASFLYQPPTPAEYRTKIRSISRTLPYIVAENAAGALLGYVCAHPWRYGADAYAWDCETTIYLAPDVRRLGVGSMLYHALLAALALQGYWNAYGVLADPNPGSEAFHLAFGFECEGRQKRTGYKNGWQGVSYWLLALQQGEHCPQQPPRAFAKKDYATLLPLARAGFSWQQIVAAMQPGAPRCGK